MKEVGTYEIEKAFFEVRWCFSRINFGINICLECVGSRIRDTTSHSIQVAIMRLLREMGRPLT